MFSASKKLDQEDQSKQENKQSMGVVVSALSALLTGFLVHPGRVLLNEAITSKNPFETIYGAKDKVFNEVGVNMRRSFTAIFLQLMADKIVNTYYGHDKYMKNMLGIPAVTAAGVAATILEVRLMRESALREHAKHFVKRPSSFKYSVPILGYFTAREFWFCLCVFKARDLEGYQKIPLFLSAALATAMFHKLVAIEVTKDIRRIVNQVPDYSIGFKAVFRNLAYGGVYTYKTLSAPIDKPKTTPHLIYNFFSATCGVNMFFWRLAYLIAFSAILNGVKAELNQVETKLKAGRVEPEPIIEKRFGMKRGRE